MRFLVTLALVNLLSTHLFAAQEKILLPIAIDEIEGRFGSIWQCEIRGYNAGDVYIRVGPKDICRLTCPTLPANPHSDFRVPTTAVSHGDLVGAFIYVDKPGNEKITLNLRVFDVSREATSWGTEIPVIREGALKTGTIRLVHVPTDEAFRVALRVYDFDGTGTNNVQLAIFRENEQAPAVTTMLLLARSSYAVDDVPPQIQFTDLVTAFPVLKGAGHVRIELIPQQPMRYWAFASVTNDETQHVTTVTP